MYTSYYYMIDTNEFALSECCWPKVKVTNFETFTIAALKFCVVCSFALFSWARLFKASLA